MAGSRAVGIGAERHECMGRVGWSGVQSGGSFDLLLLGYLGLQLAHQIHRVALLARGLRAAIASSSAPPRSA